MTDHRSPTPGPEEEFEGLVRPEDLASASRSCSAIVVIGIVILLILCVFLVGTLFFR